MTDEDILKIAEKAGIKFGSRWGTCFTGNKQILMFARMIEDCLKLSQKDDDQ